MIKKCKTTILTAFIIIGVAVLVTACEESEGYNPPEKSFEVISDGYYEGMPVMELKDKETGVHYLIVEDAITVMYNADGTIKVD